MDTSKIAGKMSEFLLLSTQNLSTWLEKELPSLEDDWWQSLVYSRLSYQQQLRVERNHISSLGQLDLAAILRVFDNNWYLFSPNFNFSRSDRNYIKEMQTVRNRWAHIETGGIDTEDVYRDIDTIQRVLSLINSKPSVIEEIKQFKKDIFADTVREPADTTKNKEQKESAESSAQSAPDVIAEGKEVRLISDHSQRGVVMQMDGQELDSRCTVWMNNKPCSFYLSQLEAVLSEDNRKFVSLPELHSLLTSLQIRHPSLSNLYSLNAARIDFVPYQFRPALKIIRSDRPRLLIADGVGVGKTIEAGLILRELQARNNIESVLIICPKPLVAERKWQLEMKRFDERFTQLDGRNLRICIEEMDLEGEWPDLHSKTIIPYSLFDEKLLHGSQSGRKRQTGLLSLDPPPHFDLVIVDEAHHIRNSATFTHQGVRFFCDHAEAVVFLTATPIQMGNQDLFTLLNVLRPDLIIDHDTFEHMAEPNPYINAALSHARAGSSDWQQEALSSLQAASETAWGSTLLRRNPIFQDACNSLQQDNLNREDRVILIREIERFHSFSRLINRTRRRDISNFCIRRTETNEIAFTPDQQEIHDELLRFETIALSMLHGNQNVGFMMSTIRRQAASCIFGLVPFMSDILNRRISDFELAETTDVEIELNEEVDQLMDAAVDLEKKAARLSSEDPKFDALFKIISDKQKLDNNKIMVFSSFRHTLAYLENRLESKGIRVAVVHGDVADDQRIVLRQCFEKPQDDPRAIDVMLFSEVGCEGLDYQFCDAIVNYDLPWNPMRIEQRIGRIDRRGQKSDFVTIFNFITPGTVDGDIYTRCLRRIGIFEESIGDCEEILGDIHRQIKQIAENIELTDDERREKLEQIADNEVNKVQEQRKLEDREHELFGIQLPRKQSDDEVRNSESYWLTSAALERFVNQYIISLVGPGDYILGDKDKKTLRLSQDARTALLNDYRKLTSQKTPIFRSWEKWLKGSEQHCSITFESECAADNRDIFFIMPLHPLVLQAAAFLESPEPVYTAFTVTDSDMAPGVFNFAIYAWEYKGVRPEIKLVPVCDDIVRESFFDNLESGVALDGESIMPAESDFGSLDKIHHGLWKREKEAHKKHTQEICSYRLDSLQTSNRGRINVVEDQLSSATNEKIRKMRQAQLNNIQNEYERELAEIKKAELSADIHSRPIVFGVVKVVGGRNV